MIRLVLDVSVLVSAAIAPGGAPAQLLRAIRDGGADLVVSPALLEELREVLVRPKLRRYLNEDQAARFAALVGRLAIEHPDEPDPPRILGDPDDDYLVALARAAGAVAIVTGDKGIAGHEGLIPLAISPREALRRIERGRRSPGRQ